jgi:hypothetical protein
MSPLLEEKGDDEGYPFFMTTDAWAEKCVEGFVSSWTELKHDTVLYGKQNYAEMGGDDIEEKDDRGYVEPEPEIYTGLAALIDKTSKGLEEYGYLSEKDKDNLTKLSELATRLAEISTKELTGSEITDDDYELIRSFGGSLEHFWDETIRTPDRGDDYIYSMEFPSSLVTDVATDPSGQVLECATGGAADIYVLVPIDGQLHVARGSVFSFYQFPWPMNDRLTDTQWRTGMGFQSTYNPDGTEDEKPEINVEKPWWTQSFRYYY